MPANEFIIPRLDYHNALLAGSTNASLKCLQFVQEAAARVLNITKKHISTVLASLHWLPFKFRMVYKM